MTRVILKVVRIDPKTQKKTWADTGTRCYGSAEKTDVEEANDMIAFYKTSDPNGIYTHEDYDKLHRNSTRRPIKWD